MKFLAWLSLFLLVNFLHQSSTLVGADIIEETCKETNNPILCVKTLKSNPQSSTADVKGLVHIMLEANLANGKYTSAKVSKMFKDATKKGLKNCLDVCAEVYDTAATENFPTALTALEANDPGTAKINLSAALDAPETCKDTFSEDPRVQTPPDLAKWNAYVEQLITIGLAMLNNLG